MPQKRKKNPKKTPKKSQCVKVQSPVNLTVAFERESDNPVEEDRLCLSQTRGQGAGINPKKVGG